MRQIAPFLGSVFGVTWILLFLMRSFSAQGEVWTVLGWLLPTVWSPTLVALILMLAVAGAAGTREEIRARLSRRRGSGRWLVLAGVVPSAATLIAVFTARAAGDAGPFVVSAPQIVVMVVLQLVTGAIGEELGWRGFLLPRLGESLSQMTAAWVMAVLWSLWHVAAFFLPGTPHHDLLPPMSSLLFTALFGFFLAFVFNRTGESVLATILAHLSLNIALGFGGAQLSSVVFWRTLVAIFGALALLISLTSHRPPPQNVRVPVQAK